MGPMRSPSGNPEIVTVTHGLTTLSVAPALGGGITRFSSEVEGARIDWLRPADPSALRDGDPGGLACFPLVPYSNRIRDGAFPFGGRLVTMPRETTREADAEHGHGWASPWAVTARAARRLVIEYRHAPDAWPFAYRARQTFALDAAGLSVTIELSNDGAAAMPCGLGLHPYFPRTPRCRLTASVDGMWRNDERMLPQALVAPSADRDPGRGLDVDRVDFDTVFTGWSGAATIVWRERRRRLVMRATAPLRFLVVYTPTGEPYFCAEPVSNCTDAFNLAAAGRDDTGMIVLAPGESAAATVRFDPADVVG